MKSFWYLLALAFLFSACKSLQPVTQEPAGKPYDDTELAEVIGNGNVAPGGEQPVDEQSATDQPEPVSPNGPYLPPDIAETLYAPFVQRSVTPKPALPRARNKCSLAVEVRNYDGLDGCGVLLETDDGALLRVGIRPRGDVLEAGTRISIGFEYMKDYEKTACQNEDAVVRVTCMRLLRVSSGLPRPVVCEGYDKPARWLVEAAQSVGATYITRFPWREGRFAYLLESAEGQYLYDCRGYLICRPRKNCLSFIEDFSQGQIIYEN
ncbi:hypothetical protein [Neolewinella antarctica]|uniref:Lipoprotein n=1 Tax=Neolewinella antarctica TaxID=442734 RepID=A0ABX0XBR8_9BACT|nr:hypothetical protein [Neolewinella antarctica]NJC26710.1 hypothetical protein [Neolewinella antarctica]